MADLLTFRRRTQQEDACIRGRVLSRDETRAEQGLDDTRGQTPLEAGGARDLGKTRSRIVVDQPKHPKLADIHGIMTRTNIGDLFMAGVVPGLLGLGMYMLAIRAVAGLDPRHAPRGEHTPWRDKLLALSGVWPFVLLFGLIIGGLYARLFTPTEAAGMGGGLAILIATLHGRLTLAMLRRIIIDTAYTSVSLYTPFCSAR